MRIYIFFILFGLFSLHTDNVLGQCLTDIKKIFPDRNEAQLPDDLRTVSGGNYMVISSFRNDTTGYANAGAAFVFEYQVSSWVNVGMLTPSNSFTDLGFGQFIAMDSLGETIAIGSSLGNGNVIYVYHKPTAGWTSMVQSEELQFNDNQLSNVSLSPDGLTLVGVNAAEVFVYQRNSLAQFFNSNNSAKLQKFNSPVNFGLGVAVDKQSIMVSCLYENNAASPGSIAIYSNNKSAGYPLVSKLTLPNRFFPGLSLQLKGDLLVCPLEINRNNGIEQAAYIFKKKKNASWNTTIPVEIPYPYYYEDPVIIDSSTIAVAFNSEVISPTLSSPVKSSIITIHKNDISWQNTTVDTIYSEILPVAYQYVSYLSWSGDRLAFVSSLNSSGSKFVNSVTTLTRADMDWVNPQKINISDHSSNLFNFGSALVKSGGNLLVGSPNDSEAGTHAGAVDIFELDINKNWLKVGKILPPWESFTNSEFGNTISATEDLLAVGAPTYGKLKNGYFPGKVYVYKKTGATWANNNLLQIIDAPDNVNYNFGSVLSISSKVLAIVGIVDVFSGAKYGLTLFESNGSGFVYKETINLASLLIDLPTVTVRNDSIFLFNGLSGTINTEVAIYAKNPTTGSWEKSSTFDMDYAGYLSPNAFDYSKISIEVSENHVFIGIPKYRSGSIPGVGRVYVYNKLPGTRWPSGTIHYSGVLSPQDKLEYGYFGYSISNTENTLVIGAPGAKTVSSSVINEMPRNKAGSVYVFTSLKYDWSSTLQLIKYQGTQYAQPLSDFMGWSVESDKEFYFAGAPFENNSYGAEAGAVYTLPTPPLVKLIPPVCVSGQPIQLIGYPFEGTWTGDGLVANSNGIFDPKSVGIGSFLLTYTTPNCAYEGKLYIEVISPITTLLTPQEQAICPTSNTSIKIQSDPLTSYIWYYAEDNSSGFNPIPSQTSSELVLDTIGYYYADVTKFGCTVQSAITHIVFENIAVTVGPQEVVCDRSKTITLKADPSGGSWTGSNVTADGTFNPQNMANGKYPITYTYTSSFGCQYSAKDSILVHDISSTILSPQNDYCLDGFFNLKLSAAISNSSLKWFYKSEEGTSFSPVAASNEASLNANVTGYYYCELSDAYCQVTTNVIKITPPDLIINLMVSDSIVCMQEETALSVSAARKDVNFEWYYTKDASSEYTYISTGEALKVLSSGLYKVTAGVGVCTRESRSVPIYFIPSDSIIPPNVFTPNDDDYNQTYSIKTNLEHCHFFIFNSWGKKIYHSIDNTTWDGQNQPSGTYYWLINYVNCKNEEQSVKGWVQLVR